MFSRIPIFQGPGPGFKSGLIKFHFKRIWVLIQVYKDPNISVYVIIIFLFIFIKKVLTCQIK